MRFARSRLVLMLILGVTTERAEEGLDLAAVKNAPNVIETTDGSALRALADLQADPGMTRNP